MGEKHVLTIPGRFEKVKSVCQFVADGAQQSGLDETAIFHVELACDEACTNIIEHAYGPEQEGKIEVSWQVEKGFFRVTIHDNGRSFDPDDVTPPVISEAPESDDVDDLRVGGLGVHFMRKLMDEVNFTFDQKTGNTLIMVKKIPDEQEQ